MTTPNPSNALTTRGQWLALTAALLGWMFDGLEMGLFPLVAKPALGDLVDTSDETIDAKIAAQRTSIATSPATADSAAKLDDLLQEQKDFKDKLIIRWLAVITAVFLIGAATGGVLFGWLGDRVGRVRAMTLSILTYALFSGACGLAAEAWQVAVLRFIASLGMGGEWSLGVALVMEVWPNRSRAWLAGIIGAAANFGYMFIAVAGLGLSAAIGDLGQLMTSLGISNETRDHLLKNSGWRLLMLFGALPAILTFLIQIFVPESHRWEQERKTGATSFWETRDLLGVLFGAAAACGMIALLASDLHWGLRLAGLLIAFSIVLVGYLYPVRRYLHRLGSRSGTLSAATSLDNSSTLRRMLLGAALSGIALLGTWGTMQQAPYWVSKLPKGNTDHGAYTQMLGAAGAVVGCVLAALAGNRFGRRKTYFGLCLLSMISIFALYRLNTEFGAQLLVSAFIAGALTAAFYGWLPLYLPELFRTRVRATGQGFSFNFGRVLAAIGVMQLPVIMQELHVDFNVACPAISLIYIAGMILIWFAPETRGQPLPDDLPET